MIQKVSKTKNKVWLDEKRASEYTDFKVFLPSVFRSTIDFEKKHTVLRKI